MADNASNQMADNASNQEKDDNSDNLKKKIHLLEESVSVLKKDKEALDKDLKLVISDYHNLQKRNDDEMKKIKNYSISKFANDMLSVADDIDRLIDNLDEAYHKVVKMIQTNITKVFASYDITIIPSKPGDDFDYNIHQVLARESNSKFKSNQIIKVISKGYKIKDRILRHSLVIASE